MGAALAAFYGYYGETRQMWAAAHRDVDDVPALQGPMARFADDVAGIGAELIDGTSLQGEARVVAETTLLHALSFPTWADLEARGLDNPAKVVLVLRWLQGIKDSVTPVD